MNLDPLNRKLTKLDLVLRISTETGLGQRQVADVIQRTLDQITDSLANGIKVELRDFGVFNLKIRKARVWNNPSHQVARREIPSCPVVKFKAGKEMRDRCAKMAF